jgi:hypothetical protein
MINMFTEKTLDQQVNDFLSTVQARENKITNKINGLNREAGQLKEKIDSDTEKMLELELSDDAKSADEHRNTIRIARARLEEINGEIDGYSNQLKGNNSLFIKELEKIKVTATKAEEQRLDKNRLNLVESEKLKKQRDEIDQKIKQLSHEYTSSSDYETINQLKRVASIIDPRIERLSYGKREDCLKQWVRGGSIDSFFRDKELDKGSTVTHGPDHLTGYENGMPTSSGGIGGGNVPGIIV